jgi:hypothetical protein
MVKKEKISNIRTSSKDRPFIRCRKIWEKWKRNLGENIKNRPDKEGKAMSL